MISDFIAAALPFVQDFSSLPSGPVTAYQIGGAAADGKFDSVAVASGSTSAITSGRLVLNRGSGSNTSFTRFTDITTPAPSFLIWAMNIEKTGTNSATTPGAYLRVGSGLSPASTDEASDAGTYAKLGIVIANEAYRYQLKGPATTDTATAANNAKITWVMNRTAGAVAYLGPNGTTVTIGKDSTHAWVNNALRLKLAATTAGISMTDLKFAHFSNAATFSFDSINVSSPTQYALNLATVGSGTVTRSSSPALYTQGAVVALTATPATG